MNREIQEVLDAVTIEDVKLHGLNVAIGHAVWGKAIRITNAVRRLKATDFFTNPNAKL